jgi:hypothetical protein
MLLFFGVISRGLAAEPPFRLAQSKFRLGLSGYPARRIGISYERAAHEYKQEDSEKYQGRENHSTDDEAICHPRDVERNKGGWRWQRMPDREQEAQPYLRTE